MPSKKRMQSDIKAYINAMKIKAPNAAKEMEKFVLKENDFDKPFDFDPEEIIKYYPGSPKGPLPEDDPEHYSKWFMKNQPVEQIYGKGVDPDFRDIGVKWKYAYGKQKQEDDVMIIERKDDVASFMSREEAFQMETDIDSQPEFDVANFEKYDWGKGKLPYLRFHSHIQSDELLPIPDNHTLDYSKIMPELERWTLFQQLP